ncbi:MAG: hypothetical protein ACK5T0_02095 [Vampirovibrionales bacterium]
MSAGGKDRTKKNASLAPQQINPFAYTDSKAFQSHRDQMAIDDLNTVAVVMKTQLELDSLASDINHLPVNDPARQNLIIRYNEGSKLLEDYKKDYLFSPPLEYESMIKRSFSESPAVKKTLDLLKSLPTSMAGEIYKITDKLADLYTLDDNAPTVDIQKHLAMLEPMTESIYKILVYQFGTQNDQNGQIPEAAYPDSWGTQAQNLSWTPFANNAGNGGGLSIWS